jgi:uncharacterized membrane protein YcaP (DUF421 family)
MDIVVRATIAYAFILLLMRIAGRRELSTLEPFDLIMLVVIGDLIHQGVTQNDFSVTGLILAAGTIAVLQTIVSFMGFRFTRVLQLPLEGEPIVLVQDGELIERNLKRERLLEREVFESARMQNIGSISEVAWAILETSGEITFVKKSGS